MYQGISDYLKINLDTINAKGYERKDQREYYERTIESLKPFKFLLDKIYEVSTMTNLPAQLSAEANGYLKDFVDKINELEADSKNEYTQEFFNNKNNLLKKINDETLRYLEPSPNNKFLFICNTLLSFKPDKLESEESDLIKIKNEQDILYIDSKRNIQSLTEEINEQNKRVEVTLKELQEKSANAVISNYAKVFKDEAGLNYSNSKNWLLAAILLSLISIGMLVGIIEYKLFDGSERIQTADKVYFAYDYSKLIAKALLVTILIYLITYSFKKYSVYKHLETINRHRHNALNSYGLFAGSIIGNDASIRNNLLLQVSKAIYEYIPTGFLASKQEDGSPSGILEITKILSEKS